jgi:predicted phosphoribosyltransferase
MIARMSRRERFRDRREAGEQLAWQIAALRLTRPVVMGIPRGGVVVAAPIAQTLRCPLGVVVARKLGAPTQPELAMGAVTADGSRWLNEDLIAALGVTTADLEAECEAQVAEARRRVEAFGRIGSPVLAGAAAIVVDDGLATGATARAALREVRGRGAARVVLAVPVAPPETAEAMTSEADDVVCLVRAADFVATGQFYEDFGAVNDDVVRELLEEAARD